MLISKILQFLIHLLSKWENRESLKLGGAKRSNQWPFVRRNHLLKFPNCAVCGKPDQISVHHKKPFNKFPELELSPENLISLCEAPGREHHLNFGHLGSFLSWNESVVEDCQIWASKIKNRP